MFTSLLVLPVNADKKIEIEEDEVFEVEGPKETIDTYRPLLVTDYERDLKDLTKQLVDQNVNIKNIKEEIRVKGNYLVANKKIRNEEERMERMAKRLLKFRYEEDDKTLKPQVYDASEETLSASPSSLVREITMGRDTVINSGNYQEQYHSDGNMNDVGVRHSYRNNAAMMNLRSMLLAKKSAVVETGVQMRFTGSPSSANIDIAFRNLNIEAYCNSRGAAGRGDLFVDQVWYDVSANKATPYTSFGGWGTFDNFCAGGSGKLLTKNNYRVNLRNRLVVANAGHYVAYSAVEGSAAYGDLDLMSGGREFSWNRIEINFR